MRSNKILRNKKVFNNQKIKTKMKRIIFALTVLMNTVVLNAQTTVGTVATQTTLQGKDTKITSIYTTTVSGGLGGVEIGSSGKNTTIIGNSTNIQTTYTTIGSAQTFINGEKTVFNQQGTITTINKTGISTAGTITGSQLFTGGMNVGNEIINLKDAVSLKASASSVTNLTNRVTATETNIANLQNNKADKTQVALDIKKAKDEAIKTSNDYTDSKFTSLDNKVNTEVARLDKRIGATDTKVADLTKTVESNKAEAKAYTDAESIRAINAENALGNRIDKEAERAREAERELRTDLSLESRRARLAEGAITNEMMGIAAMSAAMSAANGSQIYNSQKRGNLSFGTGFYGNAAAVSAGFSYFVSPNAKISANVASGSNTRAAAAGLGFSFGF
jgi:hypothetical protein